MWQIFARTSRRAAPRVGIAWALAALLGISGLGISGPTFADKNFTESQSVWRQMDNCSRAAQKQFPDHTADANAKREAARLKCLRASNLPAETASPVERDPVDVIHR